MNPRTMNPRQRQGLLLVIVALIGLIGVFVLIANYVSSVSHQVGPKVEVLELRTTLPAYEPLQPSMLKEVPDPVRWAPREAVLGADAQQLEGLISQVALNPDTVLQWGMLGPRPEPPPGYVEVSIQVDPVSGVDAQIPQGGRADLIETTTKPGGTHVALTLVHDVEVLSGDQPNSSGQSPTVVTLAVKPGQAQKIHWAQAFAQLSLNYLPPGKPTPAAPQYSQGQ